MLRVYYIYEYRCVNMCVICWKRIRILCVKKTKPVRFMRTASGMCVAYRRLVYRKTCIDWWWQKTTKTAQARSILIIPLFDFSFLHSASHVLYVVYKDFSARRICLSRTSTRCGVMTKREACGVETRCLRAALLPAF